MRSFRLRAFIFLAIVIVVSRTLPAAEEGLSSEGPVIRLPDFKVVADWFSFNLSFDREYKIVSVVVTEVTPGCPLWKYGLRKGYLLKSINHLPVAGMKRDDFNSLMKAPLEIGRSIVFSFVLKHGLFARKTSELSFTIEAVPKTKEPKMSEPMAMTRPPSATLAHR